MDKLLVTCVFSLGFLFTNAHAALTPQQVVEGTKIVSARAQINQAHHAFAAQWSGSTVTTIAPIMGTMKAGEEWLTMALANLSGVQVIFSNDQGNRAQHIANMITALENAETNLTAAGDAAEGAGFTTAAFHLRQAAMLAETFDRSPSLQWDLSDPTPELGVDGNLPETFVGPHGHYQEGMFQLTRGDLYTRQGANAYLSFYRNVAQFGTWPACADALVPSQIRSMGWMGELNARAQGLHLGLELPADAATLDAWDAGSTPLRSRPFRRALLALALTANGGSRLPLTDFVGGEFPTGSMAEMAGIIRASKTILDCLADANADSDVRTWLTDGDWRLLRAINDVPDGWKNVDAYVHWLFAFVVELSEPPNVVGFTCGAGTHEENGVCLPDFTAGGPPRIASPPCGSTLAASESFVLEDPTTLVSSFWLDMGSHLRGDDVHQGQNSPAPATIAVTDIPSGTIYATLWYQVNGTSTWHLTECSYAGP